MNFISRPTAKEVPSRKARKNARRDRYTKNSQMKARKGEEPQPGKK